MLSEEEKANFRCNTLILKSVVFEATVIKLMWKTDQWLARVLIEGGRWVTVLTKDTCRDFLSDANATILTKSLTLGATAMQACKLST